MSGMIGIAKCLKIIADPESLQNLLVFMSEMYSVNPGRLLMVA